MEKILSKPKSFFDVFYRKPSQQKTTHYCPGCGHGILHKLIAKVIDEYGIQDRSIVLASVGCSVFCYYYFHCASISCAHGRAPAVGTAISRAHPDSIVISYQGDGDLAAIGTAEIIHAANRGENMIVFFVNNNVYGMTGGQMAPTTLIGQKTTTSPYGRSFENEGAPIRMSEIISQLDAPVLVARTAVNNPKNVRFAEKIIRKGFKAQIEKKGFVFIEVLSQCPTNWKKTPIDACKWIDEIVSKNYPLGILKDEVENRKPLKRSLRKPSFDEILKVINVSYEEEKKLSPKDLLFENIYLKTSGFGGQGVLSLGLFIADFAMKKGYEVTWLPSYGPEMRGGTANCSVVISKEPIPSPIFDNPNILIAMNTPSIQKFGPAVPENGIIIYNSSLIQSIPQNLKTKNIYALEMTDIAKEIGNIKVSNTIGLGLFAKITGMFSLDELKTFMKSYFQSDKIYELNCKALEIGYSQNI